SARITTGETLKRFARGKPRRRGQLAVGPDPQEAPALCSRKAAASVRSAPRDLASVSVECSTIAVDGSSGSPKRWLTSIVPGGASRQGNAPIARPAETAAVTTEAP